MKAPLIFYLSCLLLVAYNVQAQKQEERPTRRHFSSPSLWLHASYDRHLNGGDARIISGKGHTVSGFDAGGYTIGAEMRIDRPRLFLGMGFSYRHMPQSMQFSFDPSYFGRPGAVRHYSLDGHSDFLVLDFSVGYHVYRGSAGTFSLVAGIHSDLLLNGKDPEERVLYTGPAANGAYQTIYAYRETQWNGADAGLPLFVGSLELQYRLPESATAGRRFYIGLGISGGDNISARSEPGPHSGIWYFDDQRTLVGESSYTDHLIAVNLKLGFCLLRKKNKQST